MVDVDENLSHGTSVSCERKGRKERLARALDAVPARGTTPGPPATK
ncbi:hypothetical protein BN2537_14947 [Streptomyces venezuelae]|nr:hypothetical protein BN2537_14947 [Streptomyces venezuelae]